MPEIRLPAEAGRPTGSRPSGRLRSAGKVPAVVYGHAVDPLPVAVDARALRAALTTDAGLNALIDLDVGGTSHLTMPREVQRDPVRNTVVHVDFQIVGRDEVMAVDVPITLVGEAVEVHRADGVVAHELFNLTLHATPGRIPNAIEVDVSGLVVGDTVRVGDLKLPEGVTTEVDPEVAVVVAQPPQIDVAEEEAEAAADTDVAAGDEGGG